MTDDEKIAAVKAVVYSQSPAPCGAIDEIVAQARGLDRGSFEPITPAIIDIIYAAHGSPEFPAPPAPPEVEQPDGGVGEPEAKEAMG